MYLTIILIKILLMFNILDIEPVWFCVLVPIGVLFADLRSPRNDVPLFF
jgi:hypothetical protein